MHGTATILCHYKKRTDMLYPFKHGLGSLLLQNNTVGLLSSGDEYSRHFDAITSTFPNKFKVVNDIGPLPKDLLKACRLLQLHKATGLFKILTNLSLELVPVPSGRFWHTCSEKHNTSVSGVLLVSLFTTGN